MKDLTYRPYLLLAVLIGASLAGCEPEDLAPPPDAADQLSGAVRVSAPASSYPFVRALADSFAQRHPGVSVAVDLSGADGGFAQLGQGGTDIVSASRHVEDAEVNLAAGNDIGFIEIPIAYDALAVVASPSNRFLECLSVTELRKAWRPDSTVSAWKNVRASFPEHPIRRYRQLAGRVMYDAFATTLLGEEGTGSTFTTSENDSMLVQQIVQDTSGIALVRYAFYYAHRDTLRLIGIDDGKPENGEGCVQPSVESMRTGQYGPLTRTEFIYVSMARAADPAVRAFVDYYVARAGDFARERGYVPLTAEAYQAALDRFRSQAISTVLEPPAQSTPAEQ